MIGIYCGLACGIGRMHSLNNSLRKRLYTLRLKSESCARVWSGKYYQEHDGVRLISCRTCPKFDADNVKCTVPFGSPIRKCISSAQEANLHFLAGKDLLEIGFGKHSIPQKLVKDAGGTWTGIEPMLPTSEPAAFGTGGYGQVAEIPFGDCTFDIVAGIQTLEHWEEPLPGGERTASYSDCLREIHRVLKPGGSIYFDAPIHLHGHEMFIAGDFERIRGLLDPTLWCDIGLERWREVYEPLERYPTPDSDLNTWALSVSSYPDELLQDLRENGSVSLVTISAVKRADS